MADKPVVYWACPLCSQVQMPYGTTCKKFHEGTCENILKIHITGKMYLGTVKQESPSVGIAQISDEGK